MAFTNTTRVNSLKQPEKGRLLVLLAFKNIFSKKLRQILFKNEHQVKTRDFRRTWLDEILDFVLGLLGHPLVDDADSGIVEEVDFLRGGAKRFLEGRRESSLVDVFLLDEHFVGDGQLNAASVVELAKNVLQ